MVKFPIAPSTVLILLGWFTLDGEIAQAAECKPPPDAKCSRSGDNLMCSEETCDAPVNGQQRCRTRHTLMMEKDGRCIIRHRIGVRTKSIQPPGGNIDATPDNRCAQLTAAQRAVTEGCR